MKLKSSTPKDLMSEIKDMDIKMVDMRFTDIPGTTQHFTIPIKFLDEDIFSDGLGFDGSSVCLLYTSPSPRDLSTSRMPSSA